MRDWPLWSAGFRPFFLAGALYAGLAVPWWLATFFGYGATPPGFAPVAWHAHEMLYGYLAAIAAGFLLTAMPNWTGLAPLRGAPLAGLLALWLAGRLAVTGALHVGAVAAAAVDVAFLAVLALVLARDIARSRRWGNGMVVIVVALFAAGNAMMHLDPARGPGIGGTIGIAVGVVLISLIGGRIIPAFTRNALLQQGPGRMPVPFNRFDTLVLVTTGAALAAWIGWPSVPAVAWLLALAGLLQAVRLARWAGLRTRREPLLAILHIGYAFVPLGFLLLAASIVTPWVQGTAAIHAWTAGAIGVMTVGMMTRVSLGHTGGALLAGRATRAIYAAMLVAALSRVVAGLGTPWTMELLMVAGIAWSAALIGFVVVYGPRLLRPRA